MLVSFSLLMLMKSSEGGYSCFSRGDALEVIRYDLLVTLRLQHSYRVLSTFLVALTFIMPRSPHASNSYNKYILVVMKITTPIKAFPIIK